MMNTPKNLNVNILSFDFFLGYGTIYFLSALPICLDASTKFN